MRSKSIQGVLILSLFFLFIVLPSIKIDKINEKYNYNLEIPQILIDFNSMQFGILHINSIFFIGLTAFFLYLSIDKNIKDAKKMHTKKEIGLTEAQKVLEDYFFDKITLSEVVKKSENNKSIKKVLKIIQYGGIEEDLVLGIQKIFTEISSKYIKLKNDYDYFSTIMPIIGMVGTIAGLLTMFATPSEIEDFESKFSGLSVALATTLYASMVTVLIFKPKARSVEECLVTLDRDYEYLEISIKQFFHKVDRLELNQIINLEEQKNEKKI